MSKKEVFGFTNRSGKGLDGSAHPALLEHNERSISFCTRDRYFQCALSQTCARFKPCCERDEKYILFGQADTDKKARDRDRKYVKMGQKLRACRIDRILHKLFIACRPVMVTIDKKD